MALYKTGGKIPVQSTHPLTGRVLYRYSAKVKSGLELYTWAESKEDAMEHFVNRGLKIVKLEQCTED